MDYVFAFNARMLAILGIVLVLLLGASFGLGMLYAAYSGKADAPAIEKK